MTLVYNVSGSQHKDSREQDSEQEGRGAGEARRSSERARERRRAREAAAIAACAGQRLPARRHRVNKLNTHAQ